MVEELGGLPPQKLHCSVLAEEAIKSAVIFAEVGELNKASDIYTVTIIPAADTVPAGIKK